jgi:hypothetical protein
MAQEFSTPPSYEPPKKRNTATIVVIILLVLLLCCCISVALMYFVLGDPLLNLLAGFGVY